MPDPAFTMVAWLVLGGALGWLDGQLVREPEREPIFIHIVVGAAGGFGGGFFIDGLLHSWNGNWYLSLVVALASAALLLGLWRAVVRGTGPVGRAP